MRRPSLGQPEEQRAELGDFYNSRTDSFTGTNVFSKPIPKSAHSSVDSDHMDLKLIRSENLSDRLSNLDLSLELQASFLAGLVSFSGAGDYFKEQKSSSRNISMSMMSRITSKDEKVKIYNEELKECFALDALKKVEATHVVVGISWGANLVVSAEHNTSKSDDSRKIDAMLSGVINKCMTKIEGNPRITFTEEENGLVSKLRLRVYGDILPKSVNPATIEDAISLAKRMPYLIEGCNHGRGKPLFYTLMPIEEIREYLDIPVKIDDLVTSIDRETLSSVVRMFEGLTSAEQLITKYKKKVDKYGDCLLQESVNKINNMRKEFYAYQTKLRTTLADKLPKIRKGKSKVAVLEKVIETYEKSEFSLTGVQKTINSWHDNTWKMSLKKLLDEHKAHYLCKSGKPGEQSNFRIYYSFCMKAEEIKDYENWNLQVFLSLCDDKKHPCVVKDCELNPAWWTGSLCIDLVRDGQVIESDIARQKERFVKMNLARSTEEISPVARKPNKRGNLKICCTGKNCTSHHVFQWHCEKCKEVIEYGFDKQFSCYCNCGMVSALTYEFKCTDPKHGTEFEKPNLTILKVQLKSLRPIPEINILILGETGAGKTTWINSFYNYLQFDELDEARRHGCLSLIPSTFCMYDAKYKQIEISTGKSVNENYQVGQSSTKEPIVYSFPFRDATLRLIDTPGIGDTRGLEQDKENFNKVLQYLSFFDEIHGICILLKVNSSRLGAMFQFCILELLNYLHNSASNNIVFCFTHSRGAGFTPGDTLPALRKLLDDNKIGIDLAMPTMYCFDSECYRVLAALKKIEVSYQDLEDARRSWKKSVSETSRLMGHIKSLEPHKVKETISLNNSRQHLLQLTTPLAELSKQMIETGQIIKQEETDIRENTKDMADLENRKMTKRLKSVRTVLETPQTVCAHDECTKTVDGNVEYSICHENCSLPQAPANTIGSEYLKNCKLFCRYIFWFLMYPFTYPCEKCGHEYTHHLHLCFTLKNVVVEVEDPAVVDALKRKLTFKETQESVLKEKEDELKQLQYEMDMVQRANVKFASFLQHSAMLPYNDALLPYLNYLIKAEELKGNQSTVDKLLELKVQYQEERVILEKQIEKAKNKKDKIMTPEDVENEIQFLCTLPRFGEEIKELIDTMNAIPCQFNEKYVDLEGDQSTKVEGALNTYLKYQDKFAKWIKIVK